MSDGGGGGPCTVRSKLNKFEHAWRGWGGGVGAGTLYKGGGRVRALYSMDLSRTQCSSNHSSLSENNAQAKV